MMWFFVVCFHRNVIKLRKHCFIAFWSVELLDSTRENERTTLFKSPFSPKLTLVGVQQQQNGLHESQTYAFNFTMLTHLPHYTTIRIWFCLWYVLDFKFYMGSWKLGYHFCFLLPFSPSFSLFLLLSLLSFFPMNSILTLNPLSNV